YLPQLGKTMAELTMDEKNRVSHRGQAARKARMALEHQKEAIHP
ncbi:MAG: Ham1 family, partial [Dehalococcoidia bacterium]|nr:Ham1 family [Dehalococcoidia bacterium]